MNKHLLVTISEDATAHAGLRFVCAFFQHKDDVRLTLFNTAPQPPAVWAEEANYETLRLNEEAALAIISSGKRAMEAARGIFLQGGFRPGQVDDKIVARNFSRIQDIVKEGESGLYDAVVFGRRGLLRLENLLDKSASEEMLQAKFAFPLWLCRDVEYDRKGVLLCVDDSEPSRRMADHVGFILQGEPEHPVTILRVLRKTDSTQNTEGLFGAAIDALKENGFPARLIKTRLEQNDNVAQAILDEAGRGRYAAVAVGRSDRHKGVLSQLFTGSVTMALFRKLTGAALWVSR
ncbi:MAG: universal stress protein UspA [Humidesulfovibrio sp.]|uniref:universal stress protein n=1 Tax=Humidesulfovibrio sp. TaxID=2910988 RepID=UPI0027F496CC|nr:universal stress protein [Humidesulfovibrio sp.]MDQ7836551.1 universal stress protein UspA [Humidesulfovibrio sp.]